MSRIRSADRITALATPVEGAAATEPHMAIDPVRPERMAVAAMLAPEGGRVPRSLGVWQSQDGGASWRGDRVVLPRYDNEGAADPLVGFAADGSLIVVGMALSERLTQTVAPVGVDRATIGSLEEVLAKLMADVADVEFADTIAVVRVGADGATQGGVLVEGSSGADKPALAIDAHPDSPFTGTVYVSWHDTATHGMMRIARSSDGGRTFSAPVPLMDGPPWGPFMAQLLVQPDGSLHAVWTSMVMTLPTAPPEAATSVWHAVSRDGGQTFSEPVAIARHAGLQLIGIPTAAVAPDGTLLVVWGQGEDVPANPLTQVRHRLYAIRSEDGEHWSAPSLVCPDLPGTVSMGLPAVAADRHGWWILTYLADDEATEVVLLRGDHAAQSFSRDRTLARRPIPVDDIYLHGGYVLMRCEDVVRVGDYVGLAAHGSTLTAAFVLPESEDSTSTPTAYVTSMSTA